MARFRRVAKVSHVRSAAVLIACLLGLLAVSATAAEGRIVKVLPHYLDAKGRHTLAPSLYERDAYQAHLRKNPDLCKALRFDIHWKTPSDVRKQDLVWEFEVMNTSLRRGSAAEAALLYRETPESAAARELAISKRRAARAMPFARPTKRDRRRLEDFLNEP